MLVFGGEGVFGGFLGRGAGPGGCGVGAGEGGGGLVFWMVFLDSGFWVVVWVVGCWLGRARRVRLLDLWEGSRDGFSSVCRGFASFK